MHAIHAQSESDSAFNFQLNDTTIADSFLVSKQSSRFTLWDSLQVDSIIKGIFHPYSRIRQPYVKVSSRRTGITSVKEIAYRPQSRDQWRFWVICFILLYIAFVRISNPNNFSVFIQSVFNTRLSQKIWAEQRTTFNFITLQMFAIYLLIAGIFINAYLELQKINYFDNYFIQYLVIVLLIGLVYVSKFFLHVLLGLLLKIKKLGVGFVSNTVSVSNFIALVIFPFIIFYAYNTDTLWSVIIMQTILAIFFISIVYRIIRIILLSHTFFTFPRIYLFIYLCALEILPVVVIVKFLNTHSI